MQPVDKRKTCHDQLKPWNCRRRRHVCIPLCFFFLQCSGFSVAKTSELLQKLDCPVLPLSLLRYLSANILAFSTTGGGCIGESVWCSQRDQTVRLSEFEMAAYGMSCKVFVVQYRTLQGGWKEKKLSGNDKLSGLGDTRVNNCTVLIFNYLILFS